MIEPDGKKLLSYLNRIYQLYIVSAEGVLEIGKYLKHQTATLPEPETELDEIKRLILEMGARKINKICYFITNRWEEYI